MKVELTVIRSHVIRLYRVTISHHGNSIRWWCAADRYS